MTRFQIEVRELRPLDVDPGALMTLTDAAKWLGLSTSALGDLMYRGVLRRVVDGDEPNPTRANRVFVEDVDKELARRRERKDDSRLRRRRGRPLSGAGGAGWPVS